MRYGTLRDGTAVMIDDDRYAPLPGRVVDHLQRGGRPSGAWQPLAGAELGPPVRPGKIICLGLNNADHIAESGLETPARPLLFCKLPSATIGPGETVIRPAHVRQLDYEAELAVVVGRPAKRVRREEAFDYVGGYTCLNDISDRESQLGDGQWFRGKSMDTFAPIGPWIVTPDEVPDPHNLNLACTVNGVQRQSSNTRHLVFSIPEIIEFCSESFTLEPGDIIATGTPGGVGLPTQTWLDVGDRVDVTIESIGTLSNPIGGPKS
jgi:2-keto-4-pentenoate hydratase/2-oxohepta-3-ene-1,7-dioic acid hydratase in catechol pathway